MLSHSESNLVLLKSIISTNAILGPLFVKINIFLFFVILKSVGSETLLYNELDERTSNVGKF